MSEVRDTGVVVVQPDQGESFFHTQVADIYRLYQQRLVGASAMDFDDLLMVTVELFAAVRCWLSARWIPLR